MRGRYAVDHAVMNLRKQRPATRYHRDLAPIAPRKPDVFLAQTSKADDGTAKSHARELVTQVESCYVETSDYSQCNTSAALGPGAGSWGTGSGQASVTAANETGCVIQAVERSASGQLDVFQISRVNGLLARDCGVGRVGDNRGAGGCNETPDAQGNYW